MRQMKKKIIIAIIVTLILTAGIAFVLSNLALSAKDKEISELKVKIADSKCLAFASDLKADSIITQSDVKVVDMKRTSIASGGYYYKDGGWKYYTSFVDENGTSQESNQAYANVEKIKESLVGRVVKANVSANTPVLDSLLYPEAEEPTKDERILEFNFLKLPSDLVENEYVDIRIRFPNGEDYSVLIGKKVEKIAGENTIFIKMDEAEIMTMGSAIIEAYMQTGVMLYVNKYTDPATQLFNEAIVDYVAKYDYAVNRLIKEKREKELRRAIAELIMVDENGNSKIDENGNIPYNTPEGRITIPTTKETVKEVNENGEKVNVEVVYIAAEMVEKISQADKAKAEANMKEITVEDFLNVDIARYAGIDEAYVEEIRLAQASNDTNILNYYKIKRVTTADSIKRTYPVKKEVMDVIRNNPNILATVIAEFDATRLTNTRVDEYYELKAQYDSTYDAYLKETIKQKMDEITSARTESVESSIKAEVDAQRAERISYLQSLLD